MRRSYDCSEQLDAREVSDAVLAASMFAASVRMIWDLATGHVSAFDRMLSDLSDDDNQVAQ
jgi:hypothetical protein